MHVINAEQGSPEWHAARLGKCTASRIADVMAKTKSGTGASRANYLAELVCQRLTGTVPDTYSNTAMAWGTEHEPNARDAYAFLCDVEVQQVGLVMHPTILDTAASPDGIVGDGLIEIKCPNSATHIQTLLRDPLSLPPLKYNLQMQWQMACTGAKWCDFVSYDPRMPAPMQIYIQRVQRDKELIADIEVHVRQFLDDVAATVDRLRSRYEDAVA